MKHSKQQDIPFLWALFPLLVMIVTIAVTISRFEGTPHIPLIVGTITAGLVAHFHGHSWKNMEEGMYQGIRLALPAIFMIIPVGLIIATWIGGGIIASLIYPCLSFSWSPKSSGVACFGGGGFTGIHLPDFCPGRSGRRCDPGHA